MKYINQILPKSNIYERLSSDSQKNHKNNSLFFKLGIFEIKLDHRYG